ncbi:MAG: phosphatase PAP2 family protein [Flavobacteriaceae bacterium]|nr:phosphatase PAP2 family protein [Flavobacteriaceae bacterium]
MREALQLLDRDLLLSLNDWGNPAWDVFWLFITNKWTAVPLYAVLVWLLYKQFALKKFLMLLLLVVLLIALTDQTANVFKYGFERLRPCHEPTLNGLVSLVGARCGGQFGFFSAHAANNAALALFIGLLLRNRFAWGVFRGLLLWTFLVAYSRVYVGVHYPGDVLFGLLLGGLYGWGFSIIADKIFKKRTFKGKKQMSKK